MTHARSMAVKTSLLIWFLPSCDICLETPCPHLRTQYISLIHSKGQSQVNSLWNRIIATHCIQVNQQRGGFRAAVSAMSPKNKIKMLNIFLTYFLSIKARFSNFFFFYKSTFLCKHNLETLKVRLVMAAKMINISQNLAGSADPTEDHTSRDRHVQVNLSSRNVFISSVQLIYHW